VQAAPTPFEEQVMPVLERYCLTCHNATKKKGDLALDAYTRTGEAERPSALPVWQEVADRIMSGDMPPEGAAQPGLAEREAVLGWIEATQRRLAFAGTKTDPGQVTIRRLNRVEYDNTVRDLLGVDLQAARDFPSDDVGYGFDNIGDVLSVPPVLAERYFAAADRIAEHAIVVADSSPTEKHGRVVELERLVSTPPGSVLRNGALVLIEGGGVRLTHDFPAEAEYELRVKAYGTPAAERKPRMAVRLDGSEVQRFTIGLRPAVYSVRVNAVPGPHVIELVFANPGVSAGTPPAERTLALDALRVDGPFIDLVLPESHKRLIPSPPSENWRAETRAIVAQLAERAYRRPAAPDELERLSQLALQVVEQGGTFERGIQVALRALLVSPHFLFRVELDDRTPAGEPHAISDHELASRLSYFLWSTMPDEELFELANGGRLRQGDVLEQQVQRMLRDDRSRALALNFAPQWLQLRNLPSFQPSARHFPRFDEALRGAMLKETELFFQAVLREDRDISTFLDADFTFVNGRLARHYGIAGVDGPEFRRVSLAGTPRGGLLTQASVLTATSNPTRTSPVKRGRWVLEQILGTPPPPPPPNIPELIEEVNDHPISGGLRARMAQHRTDPSCAACHKKMDPLGFGLENFDGIGGWRTEDDGGVPVDASGVLPGGQSFVGPGELKAVLKTRIRAFRRALAGRLLTYAIGRGAETADRQSIDDICEDTARNGNTLSALVLAVVRSEPFLSRRGEVAAPPGLPPAAPAQPPPPSVQAQLTPPRIP
jgi:hypothetical protein